MRRNLLSGKAGGSSARVTLDVDRERGLHWVGHRPRRLWHCSSGTKELRCVGLFWDWDWHWLWHRVVRRIRLRTGRRHRVQVRCRAVDVKPTKSVEIWYGEVRTDRRTEPAGPHRPGKRVHGWAAERGRRACVHSAAAPQRHGPVQARRVPARVAVSEHHAGAAPRPRVPDHVRAGPLRGVMPRHGAVGLGVVTPTASAAWIQLWTSTSRTT